MNRPTTLVAALVVVLLHAVLLVGGTVASGLSLAAFAVTHPGIGASPAVLLPSVLGSALDLLLAAADVVLGLRLWRAARARLALSACLGLSGLITLSGTVASFTLGAVPSVPFATLRIVEVVVCAAAVVLLWRPETTAWLRARSVRPAGPGL